MATRENAYLKYLIHDTSPLTERSLDMNDLSQFQYMAEVGYKNKGQIQYQDYTPGNDQFKHTVGRTGIGGVQRQDNTWLVNDTYDFNNAGSSLPDKLKLFGKALSGGDVVSALGQVSSDLGTPYQTQMRVPMTPQQIEANGGKMRYSADNTVLGGEQYEWKPYKLGEGENIRDVAQKSFADNKYKPEGSNLDNMENMILRQNKGNSSDIVYVPVKKQNQNALGFLNNFLSKMS